MLQTNLNSLVDNFLNYIKYQKRYSQHTIIAYRNDLEQFFVFIQSEFEVLIISQITSSMVRSWLASLKQDDITAKTINRKLSTLKSFYKYLLKQKIVTTNPLSVIVTPKVAKRLPVFVEEKQMQTLLNHVAEYDSFEQQTKALIIKLFYTTGIRLSELLNLQVQNVDSSYCQIKVLGKGNKERIIPIDKDLLQSIKEYIYNKPLPSASNLFVNAKGKPLYAKQVYIWVKQYLNLVTTVKKKSPHILRHSFATHLMNNGAELNAVKDLLGHSSLAATQVYTHNTIDKLKDVFKKAHPKA
jgi:integrase/recombinase XerC